MANLLVFALILVGLKATSASPPSPNLDFFRELGQELASKQGVQLEPILLNGMDIREPGVFDQLMDLFKLDKLCKSQSKEKHTNAGVENLLQIVCKNRSQILRQNADCLSGMEQTVRPSCEHVCIQQANSKLESTNDKCALAACVCRCVDSQMSECFTENKEEGGEEQIQQQRVNLYGEVMSSILSTNLMTKNGEELADALVKMPNQCAELLRVSVKALDENQSGTDRHQLVDQF